jgi:hypothetical protein
MVMEMGYPVKVSGVTDAFKQNYLIPCPKICMSMLNFDHGPSQDLSYLPVQYVWNYVDSKFSVSVSPAYAARFH